MKRVTLMLFFLLMPLGAFAQAPSVKIGGEEIVPKGLIFGDADPKSRVTAEGKLADGCGWTLTVETRFAAKELEKRCVLDYRKTTVVLTRKCRKPAQPEPTQSERVTTAPKSRCPDENGDVPEPDLETKPVSSGRTPDGKYQTIVVQPDGSRLTLSSDGDLVQVTVRYPDATGDVLRISAAKEKK
ncbi:MAG: hypothetical protein WBX15_00520 [Thermoanaerobaculia bacterium]